MSQRVIAHDSLKSKSEFGAILPLYAICKIGSNEVLTGGIDVELCCPEVRIWRGTP
jgi:hypothetical protein